MDSSISINDHLFWVGSHDRITDLFESIWPLPHGISYNSYVLADEKVILFDTVKSNFIDQYIEKIKVLSQKYGQPDYLIINHIEPDHSGAVSILRSLWPHLRIIGNEKTAVFLKDFYGLSDNIQIIKDGEELSSGKSRFKFLLTPMVHWPETMMTYEVTQKILFSGDVFGGFGALEGRLFDDEVDLMPYQDEILRYFSNIIGKYSSSAQKAIQRLKGLPISMIAPAHGPIWRADPERIINWYDQWSRQEPENGVVIAYASMYGNTARMAEAVARGLALEKCKQIIIHDMSRIHVSYLIKDAWKYKAIIFASPTYDANLFPPTAQFIRFLERKGLKNRLMGIIGTYSWAGMSCKLLREFAEKNAWELVEPVVETKCSPNDEDLTKCRELGQTLAKRLRGEI